MERLAGGRGHDLQREAVDQRVAVLLRLARHVVRAAQADGHGARGVHVEEGRMLHEVRVRVVGRDEQPVRRAAVDHERLDRVRAEVRALVHVVGEPVPAGRRQRDVLRDHAAPAQRAQDVAVADVARVLVRVARVRDAG